MNISIITGSHRIKSQSRRVADYLAGRLEHFGYSERRSIVDLAEQPLAYWAEDGSHKNDRWSDIGERLKRSDGFIIVTPEWDGMVPPALKNFFHLYTGGELAHKPALIVSVSAGLNGAYPVAELRMSSYKNSHICYIPEQLIIRNVSSMFLSDAASAPGENQLRERADYALRVLFQYCRAFTSIRESVPFEKGPYQFGM